MSDSRCANTIAKLLASLCLAWLSIPAVAADGTEKHVKEFVSSCFKAVSDKRWQGYADCYDRAGLAEYQSLYLDIMSRDPRAIPREFSTYYKRDMTFEKLRALSPSEFFAAFLGGTVEKLEARGNYRQGRLSFDIASISKAADGKYLVVVNSTVRLIQGDKTHESRKTEVTTVLVKDNRPFIELPQQMIDLLKMRK